MPSKGGEKKALPLGQMKIDKILRWGKDHPTIDGFMPKKDLANWALEINGEVEQPLRLSWRDFLEYPKVKLISDFHCVEGWSVLNCKWEGVSFILIVDLVKPLEVAMFVSFVCADGYLTSHSLENLLEEEALLAYRLDGEDLEEGLGGPLRLIVPNRYCYKSAMWLTRIKFTSKKELGYWESKGYSDIAKCVEGRSVLKINVQV